MFFFLPFFRSLKILEFGQLFLAGLSNQDDYIVVAIQLLRRYRSLRKSPSGARGIKEGKKSSPLVHDDNLQGAFDKAASSLLWRSPENSHAGMKNERQDNNQEQIQATLLLSTNINSN